MIRFYEDSDYFDVDKLLREFNNDIDLKSNPFYKCIVYDDGVIKGCLVFEEIYERIELDYIIVDNKYRKCGIGNKLVEYLTEYCKYNGISNITLEVNENNKPAINLYEKNCFKLISRRDSYYDGADGLLMMRKFDNDE